MAAFLTATLFLLVPVKAQQPPNQPQLTSKDVSDEEMQKFVAAYTAVEVIQTKLQEKLAAAQDIEVAAELSQTANSEVSAAVQESGLEPQRYNMLATAMSKDKDLLGRFQKMQKERAEKQKEQQKQEQQAKQ
jgi:hypothetical protein